MKKKFALFIALLAICLSLTDAFARMDHTSRKYSHWTATYSESIPPRKDPMED